VSLISSLRVALRRLFQPRLTVHLASFSLSTATTSFQGLNRRGELDGWGRYLDTSPEKQSVRGSISAANRKALDDGQLLSSLPSYDYDLI